MAIITTPVAESELLPVLREDRTAAGFPLPHPDNSAARDAMRLRAALILINAALSDVISEAEVRTIVADAVAALVDASPGALDTLNELAAAIGDDPNFAATIAAQIGSKAPIASPEFTGDPRGPTPALTDQSISFATTNWVKTLLANGVNYSSGWTTATAPLDDNDTSPANTAWVLRQAADAALVRALTSTTRFLTPKALADSMAFAAVNASGPVGLNLSSGYNQIWTLIGNTGMHQPGGAAVSGLPVVLYFIQDATGGRTLGFNSTYHRFPGGVVPVLSTAPSAVDRMSGIVRAVGGNTVIEWSGLDLDIRAAA